MATARTRPTTARRPPARPARAGSSPIPAAPRRLATNFAMLSIAEAACRAASVAVTLALANRLDARGGRTAGYGRIEFAFSIVVWLVLIVRDGFEVIASRELARHPRLVRPLVNHLLAVKGLLAAILYVGLAVVARAWLADPVERKLLATYGLLLFTTAIGLDFVYRSREAVGVVAASLCLRTAIYAAGVWFWVLDASRIALVPAFLVAGEAVGIGLVWGRYVREHDWPRPVLGARFLVVFLRRGRSALSIQLAQTLLTSVDLMVIALVCSYGELGLFGAPYRMVAAILTFGLIFQQVVFPSLARSWRASPDEGRRTLDAIVRVVSTALLPVAVGATVLAAPLVRLLFPGDYAPAATLLAIGVWRAPLLTLAFLYRTALIAQNRESAGVRLLVVGAIASGPLVALLHATFGLPGAAGATALLALGFVVAGWACLAREGRQPAWHHHLGRPLLASLPMILACLSLENAHVVVAVVAGAITYAVALWLLGGLGRDDLRALLGSPRSSLTAGPASAHR